MTTATAMPDVSDLVSYELGELDDDAALDLFAGLIRSGLVWALQGHYGRTATALIENGLISEFGDRVDQVLTADEVPTTD